MLKAASVRISGPKPGTGYLVAPTRIATCDHVVDLWGDRETHEVRVGDLPDQEPEVRQARVVARDERADSAIIGFDEQVHAAPLSLAREPLSYQCDWDGYGFPQSAEGIGIHLKGEVVDPLNREKDRSIFLVYSDQASAGEATPLHGFSGTPVLVDRAVVGHLIHVLGDPDDRRRPAYGMIVAVPAAQVRAILDVEPASVSIHPAKLASPAKFLDQIAKTGAAEAEETNVPLDVTVKAAKVLIGRNRPELALQILRASVAKTLEAQQTLALALAKSGEIDKAIALLKEMVDSGARDAETVGLLAGRYKDKWRKAGDEAALRASYETYREAYDRTADPFVGINAAATALYCGDRGNAAVIAEQVFRSLQGRSDRDQWNLATLGEASLLRGNLDDAREWYGRAVAWDRSLYQDIAVMRKQARLNLKYLGRPTDILDDVLPVPRVVAFAGHRIDEPGRSPPRFPPEKIGRVCEAIRDHLSQLGRVQGFGTAAMGSDILFLEEMVQRGVRPVVVMPFPEDEFRRVSMDDTWAARFDAIRDQVEILLLESETPLPGELDAAFVKSNSMIQRMAVSHAERLDERAQLLVVWDRRRQGDGPGGTADVVKLWEDKQYKPIVIDINEL